MADNGSVRSIWNYGLPSDMRTRPCLRRTGGWRSDVGSEHFMAARVIFRMIGARTWTTSS